MVIEATVAIVGAIVSGIQMVCQLGSGSSSNPLKKGDNEPLLDPPPPPTRQALEARAQSEKANKIGEELQKKFAAQKANEAKEAEKVKAQEAKQQQDQLAAKVAAADAVAKQEQEKKKNAEAAPPPPPPLAPPLPVSTLSKVSQEAAAENKAPAAPVVDNTSTVRVAPKDPPPYRSERQGLMNDKIQPVIDMLNKDGGNWRQENSNNTVTVTNGVNKFNVEGDRLTTKDNDQKTFEAMLEGFKKMNPGETAEIKAGNPALMETWKKAIEATGVKANVSLTTPEAPSQQATAAPVNTAPTMRK